MYRTNINKWFKHADFIIIDILCMQCAFLLAHLATKTITGIDMLAFSDNAYSIEAVSLLLSELAVTFFLEPYTNILRRGSFAELKKVVALVSTTYIINLVLQYFLHFAGMYSRLLMGLSYLFSVSLCLFVHIARKSHIRKRTQKSKATKSMILITTKENLESALKNITEKTFYAYQIPAIFLLDQVEPAGSVYQGIPLYGTETDLIQYILPIWCDEAYISVDIKHNMPREITCKLLDMGIAVHRVLLAETGTQIVERIGDDTVVTSSIRIVSTRFAITKRFFDIIGGMIGCVITLILFLILAPQIYKESPGPIFFSQTRIGRNGKKFKIYKFRSMYMDAEERKKDLLAQNKSLDGMIFKMDDDPRIIGSEKKDRNGMPNGIGNKIRRTSLDEFPQFWNVLKGDMSLVGTRPPTVDEWEKYNTDQRLRMSIKPGLTGMWQVSGRSKITDFNEIVALDRQYIRNMSISLDIKILFKTIQVVFKNDGAE